jgi:hypothetical protein
VTAPTDIRPDLDPDPVQPAEDDVAHMVDQRHDHDLVDRAYLLGEEVTALCGTRFVPTKNPYVRRPCTACIEALGNIPEASGS